MTVKIDGSFAALVKTVQGSPDTSGAQVVSPRLIIRPEHIGPELQQLYLWSLMDPDSINGWWMWSLCMYTCVWIKRSCTISRSSLQFRLLGNWALGYRGPPAQLLSSGPPQCWHRHCEGIRNILIGQQAAPSSLLRVLSPLRLFDRHWFLNKLSPP